MCDTGDTDQVRAGQVRLEPGQCHALKQEQREEKWTQRYRERGRLMKLSENNEKMSPGSVQVQRKRT